MGTSTYLRKATDLVSLTLGDHGPVKLSQLSIPTLFLSLGLAQRNRLDSTVRTEPVDITLINIL